MPVISCLCDDCGKSFYMKDEAIVPLTSNFIRRRNNQLKTWQDWVVHTQSHCENCRIAFPPPQCVADLERRKKLSKILSSLRHQQTHYQNCLFRRFLPK